MKNQESLLVVVHPGYCANSAGWIDGAMEEKYGEYDVYLKRLYEAVWRRRNCIMLLNRGDELPFDVPEEAEIMRYKIRESEELIERLKTKGVATVDICGEFLWRYGRSVELEEIREVTRVLPKEKRAIINELLDKNGYLDLYELKKRGVFFTPHFQRLLYSLFYSEDEVRDGCVVRTKNELEDFSVRIARELCYPIKEPKIQSK